MERDGLEHSTRTMAELRTGMTVAIPSEAYRVAGIHPDRSRLDSCRLAAAMIVQGTRAGCIVFSATNYDEDAAGLAKSAAEAIEARLKKSFGGTLTLFSDVGCSHAL